MKRKRISAAAALIFVLFASGCWDSVELDHIAFIVGQGVDQAPGSEVIATVQIMQPGQLKSPQSTSGGGGQGGGATGSPVLVLQGRGVTTFDAIRDIRHQISRTLDPTHIEVNILGESVAKNGVFPAMDLFARHPKNRPTAWVVVANGTAGDVLKAKMEMERIPSLSIASNLESLIAGSIVRPVNLHQFTLMLLSKTTAPTAPVIRIKRTGSKQNLSFGGTAVFKKGKWIGTLDDQQTRGMLWVIGKVPKASYTVVRAPDGGPISLEISDSAGRFGPDLKTGALLVHAHVKVTAQVRDQFTPEDMSKPERLKYLEKQLETSVRNDVMAALRKAQSLRADIFGFGDSFSRKYPKRWPAMEPKWDDLFARVKVDVNVTARVPMTGEDYKPFFTP